MPDVTLGSGEVMGVMSPGSSRLLKRNCVPEPEALRIEDGRASGVGSSTTTGAPYDESPAGEWVPSVRGVVGVSGCAKIRAGGGVFGRIAIGDRLLGLFRIFYTAHFAPLFVLLPFAAVFAAPRTDSTSGR
uniref:Uncharacterized protein n=1 Tax=Anopheles culicifacies TaxID=139723 RepID=A0A182MTB8_9DIPT